MLLIKLLDFVNTHADVIIYYFSLMINMVYQSVISKDSFRVITQKNSQKWVLVVFNSGDELPIMSYAYSKHIYQNWVKSVKRCDLYVFGGKHLYKYKVMKVKYKVKFYKYISYKFGVWMNPENVIWRSESVFISLSRVREMLWERCLLSLYK